MNSGDRLLRDMGHGQRIIITGSRNWDDENAIHSKLAVQARLRPFATLVSGACPTGADAIAEQWWATFGGKIERVPADWGAYGKRAGYVRNAEMVDGGAVVCLAFIKGNSKGASMTASLAEKAGIPTERVVVA